MPNKTEVRINGLSFTAAEELATLIRNYWRERDALGVRVWVVEVGSVPKFGYIFGVRSNLVNGLPPPKVSSIKRAA